MVILWFSDKKRPRILVFIFGIVALAFLLTALTTFAIDSHKVNTWEKVTGVVTDNDISDRTKTWTEFTYTLDGGEFTTKVDGFYVLSSSKELLCNPKEPGEIAIYIKPGPRSQIFLVVGGLFGVFSFYYFLNYRSVVKSEEMALRRGF